MHEISHCYSSFKSVLSREHDIFSSTSSILRIQLGTYWTFYPNLIYQFNLFSARKDTARRSNATQDITWKDYPKTLLSIETLNRVFSNDSSSYKYPYGKMT